MEVEPKDLMNSRIDVLASSKKSQTNYSNLVTHFILFMGDEVATILCSSQGRLTQVKYGFHFEFKKQLLQLK